jgi:Fuc2NAc and GlcNAc transferase
MLSVLAIFLTPIFLSTMSAILIYKFGFRIGLVDVPNERSSHTIPIPRSGGIGIWLTFIPAGFFFTNYQIFAILAGIVGLIGLFEDSFTLSTKIRLLLQLIIFTVVVSQLLGLPTSIIKLIFFIFWIVFVIGTANFYNFMDGIDGIAGLTGLVGFGFMAIFSFFFVNNSDIALMSIVASMACLGFLPFNFPKAKVFMGDVGSVFLGLVFASFVVKLSTTINIFICIVMFLCLFYADAIVTIFCRWQRGENLMQAHRKHLYQYMSNELKIPHWIVSLAYALAQLFFGILALIAYRKGLVWQLVVFGVFIILFLVIYKVIKNVKPRLLKQSEIPST